MLKIFNVSSFNFSSDVVVSFSSKGIEKGRQEEKRNTLKEQLKVKLGTISSPLEERLTTTSLEKLNELTLNIFNINSEEDVLKIIH